MLFAVSFVSDIIKSASSKSSQSTRREFWHAMSLHWPHAGVYWRSFLKQVQDCASLLPPKLHLMFRRTCAGADRSDICTGPRAVKDVAHPNSSGERSFLFHACICRKTQWLKSDGVWGQRKLLWWYVFCCCGHCRLKRLEQRQRWR